MKNPNVSGTMENKKTRMALISLDENYADVKGGGGIDIRNIVEFFGGVPNFNLDLYTRIRQEQSIEIEGSNLHTKKRPNAIIDIEDNVTYVYFTDTVDLEGEISNTIRVRINSPSQIKSLSETGFLPDYDLVHAQHHRSLNTAHQFMLRHLERDVSWREAFEISSVIPWIYTPHLLTARTEKDVEEILVSVENIPKRIPGQFDETIFRQSMMYMGEITPDIRRTLSKSEVQGDKTPYCFFVVHTLAKIERLWGNYREFSDQDIRPISRVLDHLIERAYFPLIDYFIARSTDEKKSLIDIYGVPEDKIHIIGCGINPKEFRLTSHSYQNVPQVPVLIDASRITWQKGTYTIVEAVKRLKDDGVDVEFHNYSPGDNDPDLVDRIQGYVETERLEDRIYLHGPVEHKELIEKLEQADVFVHPCEYESFGIIILEAMAAGLPGIVGNRGGQNDFFADGTHGYLINPGDSENLSTKLRNMLTDRSAYERFSKNGIETAKSLTWGYFAELHAQLYNHAMEEKGIKKLIVLPSSP